jgi:hypothetical protein
VDHISEVQIPEEVLLGLAKHGLPTPTRCSTLQAFANHGVQDNRVEALLICSKLFALLLLCRNPCSTLLLFCNTN